MRQAIPKYRQNSSRTQITKFLGLNKTDSGGEGAGNCTFSEMYNCSTDKYPFFSSREGRDVVTLAPETSTVCGGEKIIFAKPPYFVFDGRELNLGLTEGEKQIVRFGNKILIFPDGKWIDTAKHEYGDLETGEQVTHAGSEAYIAAFYLKDDSFWALSSNVPTSLYSQNNYSYLDGSGSMEVKYYKDDATTPTITKIRYKMTEE